MSFSEIELSLSNQKNAVFLENFFFTVSCFCLFVFYRCILFFMTGAVSYSPARGNETLHASAPITGEHSSYFSVKVLFSTVVTDFVALNRVLILRFPIALFQSRNIHDVLGII